MTDVKDIPNNYLLLWIYLIFGIHISTLFYAINNATTAYVYVNAILCILCSCSWVDWVMHIAHIVWKVVKVLRNEPHRISIFLRCFSRQSRMQGVDGLLPGASSTWLQNVHKNVQSRTFLPLFWAQKLDFHKLCVVRITTKYIDEEV